MKLGICIVIVIEVQMTTQKMNNTIIKQTERDG